jgi:hypothetical protein
MKFEWWSADFPSSVIKKWTGKSCEGLRDADAVRLDSSQWNEWKKQDKRESGQKPFMVLLSDEDSSRLLIRASLREPYLLQEGRNPLMRPHNAIRQLRPGDIGELLHFMNKWGPLTWDSGEIGLGASDWVDASKFWARQLRFKVLSDLYFSCATEALKGAWLSLVDVLPAISSTDPPFNSEPAEDPGCVYPFKLPWERLGKSPQSWISGSAISVLREEAMWLLSREITSQNSVGTWRWVPAKGIGHSVRFELSQTTDSLLAHIWYLFATDTTRDLPPRICPHCQILFYPPRKDRFYCTSSQQTLAAKRKWWNENRAAELLHRKEQRGKNKGRPTSGN